MTIELMELAGNVRQIAVRLGMLEQSVEEIRARSAKREWRTFYHYEGLQNPQREPHAIHARLNELEAEGWHVHLVERPDQGPVRAFAADYRILAWRPA